MHSDHDVAWRAVYCRQPERELLLAIYTMDAPTTAELAERIGVGKDTVVERKKRLRMDGLLEYRDHCRRGLVVTQRGLRWLFPEPTADR